MSRVESTPQGWRRMVGYRPRLIDAFIGGLAECTSEPEPWFVFETPVNIAISS